VLKGEIRGKKHIFFLKKQKTIFWMDWNDWNGTKIEWLEFGKIFQNITRF
jgi:hypothetical protein